ncbi:type VI secretion system accessory protein TagJ [Bowmanella yangjiangensis]|uniref:Tetratricopeptide repeat protein n=1 Tax=Bowmanella yangjiangensis TaxID=2811230 RepID=A0ABS3CWY8_9ALTE|nr:type VI secretion system accessory protein TagJ [Bowmanella yangjiangensis]MBN7821652.1 tetratricopeptide repeat protein [Bowmanella yangjiangensis]
MSNAEQCLKQGHLSAALSELQTAIKQQPANPELRVFLFQLLALMGEWNRALSQLEVLKNLDDANLAMYHTYKPALFAEVMRNEVFAGRRSPMLFGQPEEWMALCIQALNASAQQQFAQAEALRSEAFELAPASSGQVDGQNFAWIADADSRIGPFLEAIVKGTYYWIPFSRIQRIDLQAPEDLRDLVWLPVHLTWTNDGQDVALLPSRYAGSEKSEDSQIQMARKTQWQACGNEYQGEGLRLLATDTDEYPLLSIRQIILNNA